MCVRSRAAIPRWRGSSTATPPCRKRSWRLGAPRMAGSSTVDRDQPVFFYDLGSPQCYVVAETIMSTLPVVPEWEPVLGSEIAPADVAALPTGGPEIERQAKEFGLQPLRWPSPWPPDTGRAMLAATYAKRIGRGVAFS